VTSAERLAAIVTAVEAVGLRCLVMGGHAVRFYGFERSTSDFDLQMAPDGWDDLADRLARTPLAATGVLSEGNTWRPGAFRRFQIGQLPDGREEWLEFWRSNHLLSPFAEAYARREVGTYGGRSLAFLGLPDLIRSKETERDFDWDDIRILEEFLDARRFAAVESRSAEPVSALVDVRSRKGFERLYESKHLADSVAVKSAIHSTTSTVTWAYLRPFVSELDASTPPAPIESAIERKLRTVALASGLHLSLVEMVRRRYKTERQAADAADKQAIRASQSR